MLSISPPKLPKRGDVNPCWPCAGEEQAQILGIVPVCQKEVSNGGILDWRVCFSGRPLKLFNEIQSYMSHTA